MRIFAITKARSGILPFLACTAILPLAMCIGSRAAMNSMESKLFQIPLTFAIRSTIPAEAATQVTILRSHQSAILTPPWTKINIDANFEVQNPLPENDWIIIFLLDQAGREVARVENNLNDHLTILPTTQWSGPISIQSSLDVPDLPAGSYSILLGLYRPTGPIELNPGPGVSQDQHFRYRIGMVTIDPTASAPSLLPNPTLDLSGYHLTFDESFNSLSISDSKTNDGARWYARNEECCLQTTDGSATAMVGMASSEPPFSLMPNGGLNIRLQRTANAWTSGVLTSVDSSGDGFSQQYGYFEMKARFPSGLNTWPAFWMLNTAAKQSTAPAGEIDIVEYIANPGFSNYVETTLHDWSDHTTPAMSHHLVPSPTGGFHTYGMLWTAATMTFYFDGSVTMQVPTPRAMHQPYYLLADLGIGGGWPTEKTPSINDMQIEYIRAYSKR